jgi:acyl-CoA thioesterase-1
VSDQLFPRRLFLRTLGAVLPVWFASAASGEGILPIQSETNPDEQERIRTLLSDSKPHVWVFTGDSITHGAKHTAGARSYPQIFEERLRYELGRTRDWVINTGISSQTAGQIIEDFQWRVTRHKPDVVSIMIGTNDCAKPDMTPLVFEKNLITLVEQVRALQAVPILHTPNPIILNTSPERKMLPEFVQVIRKVAAEQKTLLVDNCEYWENKHKKFLVDVYRQWLNDRLHPNYLGHQQIARLLFKTLNIFDPEASTCNGTYYEGQH